MHEGPYFCPLSPCLTPTGFMNTTDQSAAWMARMAEVAGKWMNSGAPVLVHGTNVGNRGRHIQEQERLPCTLSGSDH